ncbi:MAG: restriction endonuclease subunit S, partial [Patescibacteria group bacterium]|nr:restriction endonuclease subunit S [Patescibacteria group bacterium]
LMQLRDLADIKPGFTFREAIEPDEHGSTYVVQAKNVLSGQNVDSSKNLLKTSFRPSRTTIRVRKGDIILVTRGVGAGTFRTAVFNLDLDEVVPSSSVFVIRVRQEKILPEYLSIFMNSPAGQWQISKIVSGSNVQTISRAGLENMDIPIPSLSDQRKLIDLSNNIRDQLKIIFRTNRIKQDIINASINKITNT